MFIKPVSFAPNNSATSTQLVAFNCSSSLTEVLHDLPMLQGECQFLIQKMHGPPLPVVGAFVQNCQIRLEQTVAHRDPNSCGFNPETFMQPKFFRRGQVVRWNDTATSSGSRPEGASLRAVFCTRATFSLYILIYFFCRLRRPSGLCCRRWRTAGGCGQGRTQQLPTAVKIPEGHERDVRAR